MNIVSTRLALGAATLLLGGCAALGLDSKDPTTPTIGDREAVLGAEREIGIDPTAAAAPFALPAPIANSEWAQSGGSAAKAPGHLALGGNLSLAWSTSIGTGSDRTAQLVSQPVVADGRVYTIDVRGVATAFDANSGARIWSKRFGDIGGNDSARFGGGLAYGGGRLYGTNGLGEVSAMDAATGTVIWTVQPAGPLRGAPTLIGDILYVVTQDNQIFQLATADGTANWSSAASLEVAGVFGSAAPAAGRGSVVAGFSSGELYAYRYENGRNLWQDQLARTGVSTSVSSLSDIDADPVIDGDYVYALGLGGRMVALDLLSGQRVWELNLSGNQTPWVAGEWIYTLTTDAQLLSIDKLTGRVRWINQLPRYRNEKAKKGSIRYAGPVLAGGRLIVTGSNGAMVEIDPSNGQFQRQSGIGIPATLQPVVAGGMLYTLGTDGTLKAYR